MVQKYLHKRGDRYYFRWLLPADLQQILGRREIKKSLRCTEFSQALQWSGRLYSQVCLLQNLRGLYMSTGIGIEEYRVEAERYIQQIFPSKAISTKSVNPTEVTKISPKGTPSSNGILFSSLFREFIGHKVDKKIAAREQRKPLSSKQQDEYRRYFDAIIAVTGDKVISDLTATDLKNALLACSNLPKRNLKKYKGIDVGELLEMEIPVADQIKSKTVLAMKKTLQGMFRYGVDHGYVAASPMASVRLNLTIAGTFAPFCNAEVNRMIAESSLERDSWKKWIIKLAAYTGARRGEMVQLRKQDIKPDPDSGRYYLLITEEAGDVKTNNANRQIPIHKNLIKSGFLEYVDSCQSKLFPELTAQAVTRWFTAFRDRLKIDQFDDYGNRKVFHSFRHTFVTKARGSGVPIDLVQQVVGHEKVKTGVTDRYTHAQPLNNVLVVVDQIDYNV